MSIENFYSDMGDKPPGMSLDRIDNNGDYEPSNCEWRTATQQANNKRNNRLLEFNGRKQTVAAWAIEVGIRPEHLLSRIDRDHWSVADALMRPSQKPGPTAGAVKVGNRYRATIKRNQKQIHLGYFDTQEMAIQAYQKAKRELG